jgi:polysaccharide deacetylase family protein (PEP-CTERM system associated)
MNNILTIDLEDWFHILDFEKVSSPASWDGMESRIEKNTDRLLELLSDLKITATFFSLGWVAKKYPGLIKRISANHEVGCHSMHHELIFLKNEKEVKDDIIQNKNLLEQLIGKKIIAYRSPGFSFTENTKWLVRVLDECEIVYDCSIFPSGRNHGGYEKFPFAGPCKITFEGSMICELPINTRTLLGRKIIFSGGGYFRLLPYSVINFLMKTNYVMTYFHPRDFDPGQPVLEGLSLRRKLMSYTGLKNSYGKLKRLLNDHTFMPVGQAAAKINWGNVPVIDLEKY